MGVLIVDEPAAFGSSCFFFSFNEFGGDGGVLAGGCCTLATIVGVPLGLISYC
jgi:hypothetical protein